MILLTVFPPATPSTDHLVTSFLAAEDTKAQDRAACAIQVRGLWPVLSLVAPMYTIDITDSYALMHVCHLQELLKFCEFRPEFPGERGAFKGGGGGCDCLWLGLLSAASDVIGLKMLGDF